MGQRLKSERIHLSLSLRGSGYYPGSWRHPLADTRNYNHTDYYVQLAQTAEQALFDLLYLDHSQSLPALSSKREALEPSLPFDPYTLLTYLAAVTNRIGLGSSVASSVQEPYAVARQLAVLDHLSGGRTAWAATVHGFLEPDRSAVQDAKLSSEQLEERHREFIDVVVRLWDSWEDGALLVDKEHGRFLDADKVHFLHHAGTHFKVKGPLSVPRPRQGQPAAIGWLDPQEKDGNLQRNASIANVYFSSYEDLRESAAARAELHASLAAAGRDPQDAVVLTNVLPIIGRTDSEALNQASELQRLAGEHANDLGAKLVVGTPSAIADWMQAWFEAEGSDGFNILPPLLPKSLNDLVQEVVPLLQRRGLYRTSYAHSTLRGNLGISIPLNPPQRQAQGGTVS